MQARGQLTFDAIRLENATLIHLPQNFAQGVEHLIDLLPLHDERRRESDDIAGNAHEQSRFITLEENIKGARCRLARDWCKLDAADEPEVTNIDHVGRVFETMRRLFPIRGEACCAFE